MVVKAVTATEEQAAAREMLASAIAEIAERVLAGYSDEQLLGKMQARWVVLVKGSVRAALSKQQPLLLERVSAWQLGRLLSEQVRGEVRRAQGLAFERSLAAIYGPLGDVTHDPERLSGPINGVYVYQVSVPSFDEIRDAQCLVEE
jgi:hypothetical protein